MLEKSDTFFGSRKSNRVLLHILIDSLILTGCFILSLMFSRTKPLFSQDVFLVLGFALLFALGTLIFSGFYKIIVTYITGKSAIPAFMAVGVSCSAAYISSLMLMVDIGLSEITLFGLLSFSGILGLRFIYRHIKMPSTLKIGSKKVLIYGAGSAGRQLVNGLGLTTDFSPLAFIDDNSELHGRSVGGLVVFDSAAPSKLIKKFAVDLVVLAMPSIDLERRRDI